MEPIEQEWGTLEWIAGGEIGNSAEVTIGRMVMRPGGRNDLHRHTNCEELLYLLSGRVEQTIGERRIVQEPGQIVVVPNGTPHRTHNIGDEPADIILTYSTPARDYEKLNN